MTPPTLSPIALVLLNLLAAAFPKLAPFTAVRWAADRPEVRVDGTFHGVASVDGHDVDDVLDFSRRAYGAKWQKRFGEDLVQLLSEMGHPPGDTVALELVDLDSGERRTVDLEMTAANRGAVLAYNRGNAAPPSRAATRPPATLTADDVARDLDFLVETMERQHSYYRLRGVKAEKEAAAIRERLGDATTIEAFALELTKFLARFGDGHTRLNVNPNAVFPPGYLPFLIGASGDRFVAFHDDRTRLLDEKYPYLVAIDGVPIERWVEVAAAAAADGSDNFKRVRGARNIRFLQWARGELGLETGADVEVTLGAAKGKRTKKVTRQVSDRKPTYGTWPRGESRMLKGDVGYLRVDDMVAPDEAPDVFDAVRARMDEFRDAKGIVIDVRGNGGGTRHLLKTLLPYFLDPKRGPRVVNVAAKRLEPGDDPRDTDGLLGKTRGLFPKTSSRHDAAAKKAIDKFAKRFKPKWKLPKGEFSDWHYMVVAPATDDGDAYHYRGKVALLIDGACYSATDVFCAAFKGVENVTLVGTPTGGGSGRSRPVRLPASRLELRMSSMASFQPDGSLFDTVGVHPDVRVPTAPTDFIGETDTVLDAAVKALR